MKNKKILLSVGGAVLAAAVAAGILLVPKKSEPVAVFPFEVVGYRDMNPFGGESSGTVTADRVQTVFVTETQKVKEIAVEQGQQVQKGDLLYTYDTTLSDLALERKDLSIQQLEVTLDNAKQELRKLRNMLPMVITEPPETKPDPNQVKHDRSPRDPAKLNTVYDGTGSSVMMPAWFWLGEKEKVTDDLITSVIKNRESVCVVFQVAPGNRPDTPFSQEFGVRFEKTYRQPDPVEPPVVPPTVPDETTEPSEPENPDETEPSETTGPSEPAETTGPSEPSETTGPSEPSETTDPSESSEPSEPSDPVQPAPAALRAGAMEFAGYAMTFFTPMSQEEPAPGPQIDWNSGYTQQELVSLRAQKAEEIKQLEYDIRMGKAELAIMRREADDGKVTAKFDGTVISLIPAEDALAMQAPMMKISGGGGFYVNGTVSELELNRMKEGQKVTVNSWENGMTYEGRVAEIGEYPVENEYNFGQESANITYYPCKVFLDESADLMEGSYVGLSYQSRESDDGVLMVQNAFIRTEGNQSYVYLRGPEDTLVKQPVRTGVSGDGFHTPVYSGITENDMIAFPYGKNLKENAPVFEGSDQDLYGG